MREIRWAADSQEVLRGFPKNVKWTFGRALFRAQVGKPPKAMASLMKGRLRGIAKLATDDADATFRLYYTLKCPGHLYVLYCHKKKSKRGAGIPKHEEDLIARRLKDALMDCEERKGDQP
jgi:phage-related protein